MDSETKADYGPEAIVELLTSLLSDLHYSVSDTRAYVRKHGMCLDCYYTIYTCSCIGSDDEEEENDEETREQDEDDEEAASKDPVEGGGAEATMQEK